jgi:hypothetical protein
VSSPTAPGVAVDSAGKVYVAWGARVVDQFEWGEDGYSSGPVCYATRDPGSGQWTRTDIGRQAQGDRLALEVAGDGSVYLMRGVRAWLDNLDWRRKGDREHDQESLYLERYRDGAWQAQPANTYPAQDSSVGNYDRMTLLDGDLAIDAAGNAYLTWTDDGEAWDLDNDDLRLRLATVAADAPAPTVTKHYYANGQRIATRVDGELYYILGDHLGSTSLVADAAGNEVGHVVYDAYGAIVENTLPTTLTDRLFTGQTFDASTGLYYYNSRYYAIPCSANSPSRTAWWGIRSTRRRGTGLVMFTGIRLT